MNRSHHTPSVVSALLIGILLGVSGCKDLREVDDLLVVLAIGVDETQDQRIRVTTEIIDPVGSRAGSNGGLGKRTEATMIRQQTGSTIEEAVDLLDEKVPRRLFLAHNTVIVFGERYAVHGVDRALDYLERNREYRRNQLFVVTDGTASDLIWRSTGFPEFYNGMAIRSLVEQGIHKSTSVNSTQLNFMKQYLRPSHTPTMARLQASKNGMIPDGIGLFDGGRYKDHLTSSRVPALLRFMQDTQQTEITIPCRHKEAPHADMGQTYRILRTHTSVIPQVRGKRIRFFVKVRGQAEIERLCPGSKPTPQAYSQWESQLDHTLQGQMQCVFTRLQTDDVDAIHFGDVLYRNNPLLWEQIARQWKVLFPQIQVTYDVQVQLLRHGLASKSPDVEYSPEGLPPHAGRQGVAP